MSRVECDILIVGAGPTGLFAAYYAGFRGHRVAVVDSLPELGGQITAMYPEKQILDVAGFPSVKGRSLVEGLVEQAATAKPEYLLDRTALTLVHDDDGVTVGLDDGTEVRAGAVLITAGIGKFSPRPLPAGEGWVGRGMEFFVPSFEPYAGKDVVIVGGGDSAFDWALHLQGIARSIALVHRRDAFRAHERTVQEVMASDVEIITKAQVTELRGRRDPRSRSSSTSTARPSSARRRRWSPRSASSPTSGRCSSGGSRSRSGTSSSTPRCAPTCARVFAAGDITEYPGKVRLIAVGFGEAATAVNNATVAIDPTRTCSPVTPVKDLR